MSELRSAIDVFRSEDLASLPDAAVEEGFAELQRAAEALEVVRLRWLAELDRRRNFERDGFLSTAAWFGQTFRVAPGSASADIRMARALDGTSSLSEAVASGEISCAAARTLVAARESDPKEFVRSEELLLDAARTHDIQDLNRVVSYWRNAVESRRALEEGDDDPLRGRRRLHVSPTVFGMVRIDGDLDPDTGETVVTAIRACVDAQSRSSDPDDARTPAQRRADALGEICRGWLDSAHRPEVGGERPHVTVTVSLEALRGEAGAPRELEHAGPVGAESARTWACDASVSRVVVGPRSEPLDVGRRTAVVPASLRRAVVVRDRHCRFPGCDRPQAWCDAHHVVHWADGGVTALSNLLLLCRRHHRLVHHGFKLEMTDGQPVFHRPDGTLLADRAPP